MREASSDGAPELRNPHEPEGGRRELGGADGADGARGYAGSRVSAYGTSEHASPHAQASQRSLPSEQRLLQPSSLGADRGCGSTAPGLPPAYPHEVPRAGPALPVNAMLLGPNMAGYWPDFSYLDSSYSSSSSGAGIAPSLWSCPTPGHTRASVDLSAHSAAEMSAGSASGEYALNGRAPSACVLPAAAVPSLPPSSPAQWSLPFSRGYFMPTELDEASCATTCPASTQRDDDGLPLSHNIEALLEGVRRMQLAQQHRAQFTMSPAEAGAPHQAVPDARSQQMLWEQAMQLAAQQALAPSIGQPVQHFLEQLHAQTSQQALRQLLQHAQLQTHMQAQAMAQLQAQLQPLPTHDRRSLQTPGQAQLAHAWLQAQLQQDGAPLDATHAAVAGYPGQASRPPFSAGALRAAFDPEQANALALEHLRHVAEFGNPLMGLPLDGDRSIESGSLSGQSSSSTSSQGGSSQLSRRHRRSQRGGEERRNLTNATFDIAKVLQHEDCRATVMIRNIPNMFSQKTLLCLMEPNHAGKFDLLYLPIDFKNKCNVGYAFINFTSHQHLPAFYEEFHGRKWSRFKSNKIAQINYARIQSKDALIAHFANSSLIHEDESMQPLIFASDGSGTREAWRHHESRPRHRRPRP